MCDCACRHCLVNSGFILCVWTGGGRESDNSLHLRACRPNLRLLHKALSCYSMSYWTVWSTFLNKSLHHSFVSYHKSRRICKYIHHDGDGGVARDSLRSRYASHLAVNLQAKTEGLSAVGYWDVKCKNQEKRFPFPGLFCFQGLFCSKGITMQSSKKKSRTGEDRQGFEIEIKTIHWKTSWNNAVWRRQQTNEWLCQLAVCPPACMLA